MEYNMTDTIRVWVTPTDDEDTPWVINTESDMQETFADQINQVNDTFTITVNGTDFDFEPADTFERVDPQGYEIEFRRFCQSWTTLDMPWDIYNSDADQDWVDTIMNGGTN